MNELAHARDLTVQPGASVHLSTRVYDLDGDALDYHWWQYREAGTYNGAVEIRDAGKQDASFTLPADAKTGETIHVICEVTDDGSPPLTRYQRVILTVTP